MGNIHMVGMGNESYFNAACSTKFDSFRVFLLAFYLDLKLEDFEDFLNLFSGRRIDEDLPRCI